MSSLAYFLAKDTVDHFNTVIKPFVYLSMFYFFTNPRSSFADNYVVLLCLVYCVTGIAYALAIFFEQGAAQLVSKEILKRLLLSIQFCTLLRYFTETLLFLQSSVLLPVVLTLIATRPHDGQMLKALANVCYPKWALEAFVIANVERYCTSSVYLENITSC